MRRPHLENADIWYNPSVRRFPLIGSLAAVLAVAGAFAVPVASERFGEPQPASAVLTTDGGPTTPPASYRSPATAAPTASPTPATASARRSAGRPRCPRRGGGASRWPLAAAPVIADRLSLAPAARQADEPVRRLVGRHLPRRRPALPRRPRPRHVLRRPHRGGPRRDGHRRRPQGRSVDGLGRLTRPVGQAPRHPSSVGRAADHRRHRRWRRLSQHLRPLQQDRRPHRADDQRPASSSATRGRRATPPAATSTTASSARTKRRRWSCSHR